MNIIDHEEELLRERKLNLRNKGFFFLAGSLVFLIQGVFSLNGTLTGFLFLALDFIYAFVFPEKKNENGTASPVRKVLQFLGRLAVLLIEFIVVLAVWVILWRITRMAFPFLAAITGGVIGLTLIFWSLVGTPDKKPA